MRSPTRSGLFPSLHHNFTAERETPAGRNIASRLLRAAFNRCKSTPAPSRGLIVVACHMLALFGFFAHASTHAQESPEMLKVLSFNLRYINPGDTGIQTWESRRDLVAEVIKKDAPDLLGIQEGLRPMLDDLNARLTGYAEVGCGRSDGRTQGEASAIFVRADRFTIQEAGTFWLSDTPDMVNSRSWGNQVVRICTWVRLLDRRTGRELHVFNTHMDHASQPARENGIRLILQRLSERAPAGPFILTGDFNADPGNPVHDIIRDHPLAPFDVWKSLHPDKPETEAGTFHRFLGNLDGGRIDFIYASNDLTAVDSAILNEPTDGVHPSDHFPVRATLAYKDLLQPDDLPETPGE